MKKKIRIIVLLVVVFAIIGVGVYFFLDSQNNKNYTIEEQHWLKENNNKVIDIYIPRDIAGLTYTGKGVFFDFVSYLSDKTEMTYNPVAYQVLEDVSDQEYSIELVEDIEDNQIEILEDNYVLVTKEKKIYSKPSEIKDLKIGVLEIEAEQVEKYLTGASVEYIIFDTPEALEEEFLKEESQIDSMVGLRSLVLDDVLSHDFHVAYHITEMHRHYVLTINGEELLNSIIEKTYKTWSKNELEKSYNANLLDVYFDYKGISEKQKVSLHEKAYIYAFVKNGAYDDVKNSKLTGINYKVIKSFAEFANIDMEYMDPFDTVDDLVDGFKDGKVDFFFGGIDIEGLNAYKSVEAVRADAVIISKITTDGVINSIYSFQDKEIATLKNSKIENYLKEQDIKVDSYDSYDELLDSGKDYIAMDLENFEYYRNKRLSKYVLACSINIDSNYSYYINSNDKVFAELFDFYLEYVSIKKLINESYSNVFYTVDLEIYYIIVIIVLALLVVIQFLHNANKIMSFFKKKKKKNLTKDEKIRYIDSLTSLKNRAYLNDNIEKWDSSDVFPQSIVIVDLNNIAYINDNFGHEEGDKVITEAANILIQTQLPRTEIVRTDGNEFLIYLVNYNDKQIGTYIKKLSKELKELSHGFGAAIGYSMILDEIKTIDDAVNEATLDMRSNKEQQGEES